jgi:O-antigen/teichoic acid export membrane protein
MRTINAMKNVITALTGQALSIVVSFIARIYFVKTLGLDYLGVNGLFTNILSILSVAEFGVGSAIIFSLYKPLAEKEEQKVKELLNFYKNIYRVIALIILLGGLALFPFLDVIIKDKPNVPNLNLIYFIFLFNTIISYFFIYKRSLIYADQKSYINSLYQYSFFTLMNIAQIILLLVTGNYLLFLFAQSVRIILENLLVSRKANKMFPYVKKLKNEKLSKEDRKPIFQNIKAMMYHRLGGAVVSNTDNIIISSFVGVSWVGLYSNYYLITSGINTVCEQFFSSFTAIVGNLNALESKEKSHSVYKVLLLTNFWIFGFSTISLSQLFTPFITQWLGEKFLLNNMIVTLIIINFFITGMRKSTLLFRDALGLFWYDRYKPVFEAAINVLASVPLAKMYGISGVFLGTLISTMLTNFWVEPYILYKYGFKRSSKEYFLKYMVYLLLFVIAGAATMYICDFITSKTWVAFFVRLIICMLVPNSIFLICFYKTQEFKFLFDRLKGVFKKFNRSQRLEQSNY